MHHLPTSRVLLLPISHYAAMQRAVMHIEKQRWAVSSFAFG